MKLIKGFFFSVLAVVCLTVCGCEYANYVRTASFSNITASGSDKNTVKVTFEKDTRVNEKAFDIQVRASEEVSINIAEEFKESVGIEFVNTKWNSLTTLLVIAENKPDTEEYQTYKEVQSKTYIMTTDKEVTLTFRVVVGETEDNAAGTGQILTNSKEVSDEFKIKLIPLKQSS